MARATDVKKCINRFTTISDEVEILVASLPTIAKVSIKDLAREIATKNKFDYTSTYNLVNIYCRLRAADGKMLLNRGGLSKVKSMGKVKVKK